MIQRLTLRSGERRGYWRFHSRKTYRQTIVRAQINDHNARVLLDSGAEVSILDSDFARKIGVEIDTTVSLLCEGVGGSGYPTEGLAQVKVVLAGELAYHCEVWVGKLGNLEAILGTDFLRPAGIRLDIADGVALLPDEIRVQFEGRRAVYSDKVEQVRMKQEVTVCPGESVHLRARSPAGRRLWLRRDERWIATAECNERGLPTRVKVTNVFDKPVTLSAQTIVGLWMSPGAIPRRAGFVSLGSKRYSEWLTLVYEAEPEPTLEMRRIAEANVFRAQQTSAVKRRWYLNPPKILSRAVTAVNGRLSSQVADKVDNDLVSAKNTGPTLQFPHDHVTKRFGVIASTTSANLQTGECSRVATLTMVSEPNTEFRVEEFGVKEAVSVREDQDRTVKDIGSHLAIVPEAGAGGNATMTDDQTASGRCKLVYRLHVAREFNVAPDPPRGRDLSDVRVTKSRKKSMRV